MRQQQQQQQQGGGGQPGFTTLAEQTQQQLGADYGQHGQRTDVATVGGFNGPMSASLHGIHGGYGNASNFAMAAGITGLERQMSSTTLSSEDSSPPGSSWDRLYVSNLPKTLTEFDVQQLFSVYGSLTEVTLHKRGDGQSKGCFFVGFAVSASHESQTRSSHQP